ncbi:MAG TPA: DUF5719 family protein, partial [Iamia sp.]|nr:DUF5719 family protein [Iamia sp.]
RDASFTLAIYNPYAGDARVDLAFTTEESVREPADLQGLAVAPGAVVAIDVSGVVTERAVIATTVAATRGQVVVDRIQTYDGQGAATTDEEAEDETYQREGLTVTPAVPGPQAVWAFPAGVKSGFVHEQVVLFNPADEAAEVELDVALDDPQRNGVLDPLPVTVPPGAFTVFDVDGVDSIPRGLTHSLTVRAENGIPVVAERTLAAVGEEATYVGTAASTGSPVASEHWAFASGPADDESGRIVVTNPGEEAVDVELSVFGDGETAPAGEDADGEDSSSFSLEPGARREVLLADLDDDQRSVEVVASGPVVAERRIVLSLPDDEVGMGTSVALGVPLREGLVVLN